LWDSGIPPEPSPGETVNVDSRDYGAAKGTDVKDLCEMLPTGGASPGNVIKIKASDGFYKLFDYEDVYTPEPRQGKMILTWYTKDGQEGMSGERYVTDGSYSNGMRLFFFAETLSPEGKHVFGLWDMHETLAESRWHYYYDGNYWPSSSGLAVKWVSDIIIYSSEAPPTLPTMSLTLIGQNGITQTVDQNIIGSQLAYSSYGGYWKDGQPQWYAFYTGVPVLTLCNRVGSVSKNTFVQVMSSDGNNFNFSYTQVVDGTINVPSCAYNHQLTTVNLQDVEVPQNQPTILILAYQSVNGTLLPSTVGPLYLATVGPEGLLTVSKYGSPPLSGDRHWIKSVSGGSAKVAIWWLGDFDCTHEVDYSDIIYFVDAYIAANGGSPVVKQRCDFNLDASINYNDIISFVDCYIAANTP
jgi:hypothetical protein